MPPKRAKSGGGSAGVQRWEQGLLTAPFCEDDKWKASLSFVVGNKLVDYEHINIMGGAVNMGLRRLFSYISKDDLFAQVNELGNPKNKKAKETPQFAEICEPCKAYLDNEEDIPLPLLAKLIKFRLLDIKARDLRRREGEKKAAAEKDKPKKGGDKKDRSKSPAKGKAGKKTPEPPSAKNESKLRKRGEEDTDNKYIDDEPDDGPQHYIIITGFHEPHLISFLNELSLHVDCIIKLQSDQYKPEDLVEVKAVPTAGGAGDNAGGAGKTGAGGAAGVHDKHDAGGGGHDAGEAPPVPKETEWEKLTRFWRDVLPLLQTGPDDSQLHNVARLNYTINTANVPETVATDPDVKLEYGTALFEDIACMIYDLYDTKRQWQTYLQALHLLHIPTDYTPGPTVTMAPEQSQHSVTPAAPVTAPSTVPPPDGEAPALGPEGDIRYYTELMNHIPQECVSVPLIMHCMLEQVVAWEEDKEIPSDTQKPPRTDGISDDLATHISGLAFSLGLSEEEKQILSHDFDRPPAPDPVRQQPVLIDYSDKLTDRLHHLKPSDVIDPLHTEYALLALSPLCHIRYMEKPQDAVQQARAARLQELLTFCSMGGLSEFEIDHALKQFVLECMPLSSVDDNTGVTNPPDTASTLIPWDDPYPYYQGIMPDPDPLEEQALKSEDGNVPSDEACDVTDPAELQARLEALQAAESPGAGDGAGTPSPTSDEEDKGAAGKGSGGKKRKTSRGRQRSRPTSGKKSKSPHPPATAPPPEAQGESANLTPSRPGSAGILKSPAGSRVSTSRKSSVHFDSEAEAAAAAAAAGEQGEGDAGTLATPGVSLDQPKQVIDAQKCNLDHFTFTEYMEPKVLLQVLAEASYTHPCVDTYYHKRDHTLFIAMHNPHNSKLCSQTTWQNNLHSNVGFRNYLEHVADSISEWTKEQEATYEASVVAEEAEKIHKEAEEAASRPASGKGKKGRAKSPKKSPSRGKTPGSRGSSTERPTSSNPYVRAGSLKAQKEEMDRIRAEEEEKERLKQEKRARSAEKKKKAQEEETAKKDEEGKKNRRGSRSSSKSRASKENLDRQDSAAQQVDLPAEPADHWPFVGYDVGNNLIHGSGTLSTLFPADGAQIRTEKTEFVQGTCSVRTVLLKDGHVFGVHILNPKDMQPSEGQGEDKVTSRGGDGDVIVEEVIVEGQEKAENEKSEKQEKEQHGGGAAQEKPDAGGDTAAAAQQQQQQQQGQAAAHSAVGSYGSFTAQFMDGTSLAFSTYGPQGEPEGGKVHEPEPYIAPNWPRSQSPGAGATKDTPGKGKGAGKGKDGKSAATPEPSIHEDEGKVEEDELSLIEQSFQQLYLTTPDGLSVTYCLETAMGVRATSESDRGLLVKQSYPCRSTGASRHGVGGEDDKQAAMGEVSRVVNKNGTVVKTMLDGSVQVLYADSKVSILSQIPTGGTSRISSPERSGSGKSGKAGRESPKKSKGRRSAKEKEVVSEPVEEDPLTKSQWITTLPTGQRYCTRLDGHKQEVKDAIICTATDPMTGECMQTRDDRVVVVHRPDGCRIVEHGDGTRITTVYKERQDEKTGEHQHQERPATDEQQEDAAGSSGRAVDGDTRSTGINADGTDLQQTGAADDAASGAGGAGGSQGGDSVGGGDAPAPPEGEGDGEEPPSDAQQLAREQTELQQAGAGGPDTGDEEGEVKEVMIECPGYATIRFHPSTGGCSTTLGSGTSLYTYTDGSYDMFYHDSSCLQIDPEGTVSYLPRPNNNLEMHDPAQQLQYVIRHFDPVLMETVDNEGNEFTITNCGESVVTLKGERNKQLNRNTGEQREAAVEEKGDGEKDEEENDKEETEEKNKQIEEGRELKESDENEIREGEGEMVEEESPKVQRYKQHAPRFFIMQADGSGTELLRYQDIAEYLALSEDDPATAIRMDPLPDHPNVYGITIMRPHYNDVSRQWMRPYELDTIIPEGLTSRDLKTLPAKEEKKPGPRFGTNVGQGLMIGSLSQPAPPLPQLKCPETLRVRNLIQYKPVSKELRKQLEDNLKLHADYVCDRMAMTEALQVDDPRSDEERAQAEAVQQAQADAAAAERMVGEAAQAAAVRVMSPVAQQLADNAKEIYEKATAVREPSPPPTPPCKRTKADWERDAREKREELENMRILREKDMPSYFSSELGKAFLLSQLREDGKLQAPDMEALAAELARKPPRSGSSSMRSAVSPTTAEHTPETTAPEPPATHHNTTPPVVGGGAGGGVLTPPEEEPDAQHTTHQQHTPSPATLVAPDTTPTLRPGNPTPGHATGQGSPAPIRPTNPTPGHANKPEQRDRPGAPTPKEAGGDEGVEGEGETSRERGTPSELTPKTVPEARSPGEDIADPQLPHSADDLVLTRSLATNVLGEPRLAPVRVPAYMSSGRPGAQPNIRYHIIEDPVRRHVHNASVSGATLNGAYTLAEMRGYELLPDKVDFGLVKEGNTYSFTVLLKNTGIDACRYKLKQPPPSTGLRVLYQPGPIAAGLKATLDLELFAIAVGVQGDSGVGQVYHELEITTETHHLRLPISATVLTAHEYEHSSEVAQAKGRLAPGVSYVSSRPRATQGIIRPTKEKTLQEVLAQ